MSGSPPLNKTLTIAEKAAVAKEIAGFLAGQMGGRARREEGGYRLPNGDFVTFTNGHLLEMAPIDEYLESGINRSDAFSYLPVLPGQHKRMPRMRRSYGADGNASQETEQDPLFAIIAREVKDATRIINAGDIGREGQLVMDELFRSLDIDPAAPHVLRAPVTDMHQKALAAAFSNLMPNSLPRWQAAGEAARQRQEADWALGFNGSRAYQCVLGDRTVSVGRLKGPVLGLVRKRESEIEAFQPIRYYHPVVTLDDGTEMRWKARAEAANTEGFDEKGRIISAGVAQAIIDRINAGAQGRFLSARTRRKEKTAPLPFTKTSLEIEASLRLGIPMEEITEAMQNLYQKHKLISYIGTDCPYIPETMLLEARNVMAGLSPMFGKVMRGANASARPASVNDALIGENEHHAIVPLGTLPASRNALSEVEREIFEMVSVRFAAQFYPNLEYDVTTVEAAFGSDLFVADSMQVVRYGWTEADPQDPQMEPDDEPVEATAEADDELEAETQ